MSENYFFQNQPVGTFTVTTKHLTVEWLSTPWGTTTTTVNPVFLKNEDQGSPNCTTDDVSDKHGEEDD